MDLHPYVCLGTDLTLMTQQLPYRIRISSFLIWLSLSSYLTDYEREFGRPRAIRNTDDVNETTKYGHYTSKLHCMPCPALIISLCLAAKCYELRLLPRHKIYDMKRWSGSCMKTIICRLIDDLLVSLILQYFKLHILHH